MIDHSKLCASFYENLMSEYLCKLSKSEILRLYSIVYVAMETTKTSSQASAFRNVASGCYVVTQSSSAGLS